MIPLRISMHNIHSKFSTKLQYGKEKGKLLFIKTNVMSCLSLEIKNPIQISYTILGHPLKSLESYQLSWSSNQKKKKLK